MPIVKSAAVAESSSGVNAVIAAVTGKKIRVLAAHLSASGAVNAKWITDTAGTPADLSGLAYFAAAGAAYVLPYNPDGWFEGAAGKDLGLNLSGAVAVGGVITYMEV